MDRRIVFSREIPLKKEDIESEDGGAAKCIYHLVENNTDSENGVRLDLISWRENDENHPPFIDALVGKKLKVTIEVID